MSKTNPKILVLLCVLVFTLILGACSPAAVLTIGSAGGGSAGFSAVASPAAENLLKRFSETAAVGNSQPFYDSNLIRLSLAQAGLTTTAITLSGGSALDIQVAYDNPSAILKNALTINSTERTMQLILSRETVSSAVSLMPASTRDFLDLLMAPALGYDEMNVTEYEELVGIAFGNTMLAELRNSLFTLTVRGPAPIKNATVNGNASSRLVRDSAVFSVPLSTLLTLDTPLILKASW